MGIRISMYAEASQGAATVSVTILLGYIVCIQNEYDDHFFML